MANSTYYIDGIETAAKSGAQIEWIDDKYFRIEHLGNSFHGEIVENNLEDQTIVIRVNQRTFTVKRKGELDELIKKLGLDKKKVKQLHQLESPMPGRILGFAVKIGDTVEEGTPLLTLEAMKMENVIKSDGIGVVASFEVEADAVVEKGQVILKFTE